MDFITKSAEDTQEFGRKFALELKAKEKNNGIILALVGGLGSGKTTFTQGLAKGLGVNDKIISPTFVLMRQYEIKSKYMYHIDLYRLEENIEHEFKNLGVEEYWETRGNIVVIEWADKVKELIPDNAVWIKFEGQADEERKINIR